jgi:hypothetical protein
MKFRHMHLLLSLALTYATAFLCLLIPEMVLARTLHMYFLRWRQQI